MFGDKYGRHWVVLVAVGGCPMELDSCPVFGWGSQGQVFSMGWLWHWGRVVLILPEGFRGRGAGALHDVEG